MQTSRPNEPPKALPKYRQIVDELRAAIAANQFGETGRLPSENDLGAQFDVSRLTVQRALKELEIEGLLERRPGSGTFATTRATPSGKLLGLLIPGLGETEIFEPICQGMASAGSSSGHALLWSNLSREGVNIEAQTRQLCQEYISRRVSGVFFAPHEGYPEKDAANRTILEMLDQANIPVVILDHCTETYPNRCPYDVIGIDNRRAGFRMTQHLLGVGARKLIFWGHPYAAPTVDARAHGFADAHRDHCLPPGKIVIGDCEDETLVSRWLAAESPDGFVCCNDRTAAKLMHTLDTLGVEVPEKIRIVGIDDVRYAKLLRVPLTTLRQPCTDMGAVAVETMLSRIASPERPARDINLACEIVIRRSCGSPYNG